MGFKTKTKYKGVYKTKKGEYCFSIYLKGRWYFKSKYSCLEAANTDKLMFKWASNKLRERKNYLHNKGLGILVSPEDTNLLCKYRWGLNTTNHVMRSKFKNGKKTTKFLHKTIKSAPNSIVDHKDRNPLNNKRENLRYCTISQNTQNSKMYSTNTTGYKGIYFRKNRWPKCWEASVYCNKKHNHLGSFKTKEEAIAARAIKARELFGEFLGEETKEI